MYKTSCLIIGSGPAGYTAAIYAARANLRPILVTGLQQGGQLTTTTDVDNWPGDPDGVMGPELMDRMKRQAERFGTVMVYDSISHIERQKDGTFLVKGDDNIFHADTVIVATGASAKYLGLASETAFMGRGVSGCATCDGFFYHNQPVAVVGGGNTAVEEAIYLSNIASKVYLVHRRDTFKAEAIMVDHLMALVASGKIELVLNTTVDEIIGTAMGVTGLNVLQDNAVRTLDVQGVFIAIGHTPNTRFLEGLIDMDDHGYIRTRRNTDSVTQTNVPGIFAAGDVQDKLYKQAVTSAASGCQAALDAERYVQQKRA